MKQMQIPFKVIVSDFIVSTSQEVTTPFITFFFFNHKHEQKPSINTKPRVITTEKKVNFSLINLKIKYSLILSTQIQKSY